MCGIIGIWNFDEKVDVEEFVRLRDTLTHRGPDNAGLFVEAEKNIALGHRRLSLIDLSEAGTQPICNEDKTVWLTANGEIYNYKLLRKELSEKGHKFSSASDSEVIVHAYEEWGTDLLHKLKGMFAFCIYDRLKKIFFIARDRFGIKPVYYYHSENVFMFASELKAIVGCKKFIKELDITSVCNYLTYRYIPSPGTIWKNTYKIPPAHYILVDKNQNIRKIEYWRLQAGDKEVNQQDLIDRTDHLLQMSVKEHLESDVEMGSFLSGGYDSSALVSYMDALKYHSRTFAIGFEDWDHSEHKYAGIVAKKFGSDHTFEILDKSSLDIINHLSFFYDEPLADISTVPTYFVSKLASRKVKVVLSGEGSDEVFAGYTWHQNLTDRKSLFDRIFNGSKYGSEEKIYSPLHYAGAMAMGLFDNDMLKRTIGQDFQNFIPEDPFWFYKMHFKSGYGKIKSYQYLDIKTFMSELVLTKVDRASMANSLEVRVPFLDHELLEFVFSINENCYIKPDIQKFLLYENLKNRLPRKILKRKKQGFVGPDSYYMDYQWYRKHLGDSELVKNGIVEKKVIDDLLFENDHWRLWKILVLEKWYMMWMK